MTSVLWRRGVPSMMTRLSNPFQARRASSRGTCGSSCPSPISRQRRIAAVVIAQSAGDLAEERRPRTNDVVLYSRRLRLLATAREFGSVAAVCGIHGIHRSTFYRWKGMTDRFGLESCAPAQGTPDAQLDPGRDRAPHQGTRASGPAPRPDLLGARPREGRWLRCVCRRCVPSP